LSNAPFGFSAHPDTGPGGLQSADDREIERERKKTPQKKATYTHLENEEEGEEEEEDYTQCAKRKRVWMTQRTPQTHTETHGNTGHRYMKQEDARSRDKTKPREGEEEQRNKNQPPPTQQFCLYVAKRYTTFECLIGLNTLLKHIVHLLLANLFANLGEGLFFAQLLLFHQTNLHLHIELHWMFVILGRTGYETPGCLRELWIRFNQLQEREREFKRERERRDVLRVQERERE
jgi:hypothetical protein